MTRRYHDIRVGAAAGLLVLVSSFAALPVLAQATAPAEPGVGNYPVNAGDVLEVLVWKEENLQKQVVVRPDGYFSFPLTGDVRAEGRTITAISEDITAQIARYIPDPVVSVAIFEPRGSKVYVIGQVNRPGEFPINRYVDVIQALAMAGGTTRCSASRTWPGSPAPTGRTRSARWRRCAGTRRPTRRWASA